MSKKLLSLLVFSVVLNSGLPAVFASESANLPKVKYDAVNSRYELDEYVVLGERDRDKILQGGFARDEGTFGLLGNQKIMNLPFSATVVGPKAVEEFSSPAMALDKVLVNNPAIRHAGSNLHNDFTYRGLRANGTSSLINGIPGLMTQFNAPTHMIDHIEMLDGPSSGITGSAVQYESNAAGGIVNLVTKKAGPEDRITFKEVFTGKSNFGEYLDISKRFGKNNEWGIRINTEYLDGETAIKKENVSAKSIYINLDRKTEKATTNLIAGYRDIEVKNGMRWFKFGKNVTSLPKVPDTGKNYAFAGMFKSSYGYVFGLNHNQKINDHWSAFLNAGYNHNVLDNNVMAKFSSYTIKNMNGDFDLEYQVGGTPQNTYYMQVGTNAKYEWGNVKHDITLAVDKSWKHRSTAYGAVYPITSTLPTVGLVGTGNLYRGLNQTSMPHNEFKYGRTARSTMAGISLLDKISYKKWDALVGIHHHESNVASYKPATNEFVKSVKTSGTAPTYALVYKPNENISIYGSHSEYFDTGMVVGPALANAGEVLPPEKSKQNEIGIKYMKNGFLTSLAYFDIKQSININVQREINGINKQFTEQNGIDRNKGVEWTFNGRLSDKWSAFGGALYLNARKEATAGGKNDGKRVSAQPYWSGVLGLEYAPNEKFSVLSRLTYFGDSIIRNAGGKDLTVPAYTTFDLGMKYKTVWHNVPTTLNLMVYNVFNKEYWMASRGDQAYLSTPRTIMLSTQFDF